MKEIKFRAWHKEEKRMADSIQSIKTILNKELDGLNKDYILMQYTGMQDKNGQEIYEGDIVEVKATAVKFEEMWSGPKSTEYPIVRRFVVQWQGDGFHLIRNNWVEWELEVLGNLWENPELLESEGEQNG